MSSDKVRSKALSITPTVSIFGDSISDPGWAFPTWWEYLAAKLGFTAVGRGDSGKKVHEIVSSAMYNNDFLARTFDSSNSALILMGVNDLNAAKIININPDIVIENIAATALTGALYCALPGTSKYNARNSSVTGTWGNPPSYNTIGRETTVVGSTISQTVTGRYVSFTLTSIGRVGAPAAYQGEGFDFSITNALTDINTIGTSINTGYRTDPRNQDGDFLIRTYLFDTGVSGDHTITITYAFDDVNDGQALFVDWFGGWDDDVIGNTVVILSPPSYDYNRWISVAADVNLGANDVTRNAYNLQLKSQCAMLREHFKLPVKFVDVNALPSGGYQSDGLHPNSQGMRYISDVVAKTISGEF